MNAFCDPGIKIKLIVVCCFHAFYNRTVTSSYIIVAVVIELRFKTANCIFGFYFVYFSLGVGQQCSIFSTMLFLLTLYAVGFFPEKLLIENENFIIETFQFEN